MIALLLGLVGCVPPDCNRPDLGTCVNACCKLEFSADGLAVSAQPLAKAIAAAIASGGPDKRYFPVENNTVQPWSALDNYVVQVCLLRLVEHSPAPCMHWPASLFTSHLAASSSGDPHDGEEDVQRHASLCRDAGRSAQRHRGPRLLALAGRQQRQRRMRRATPRQAC